MTRFFLPALLATSLLSGCSDDVCDYIGDYTGTFTGDADGNVTISVTDGGGETLININLDGTTSAGEALAAVGDGTLNCEDGSLALTLTDGAGTELGEFNGNMGDESGDWSLTTGESGTWALGGD